MIVKKWSVTNISARPTLLEFSSVVSVIDWSFSVTAYDRTATTYGSVQLGEPTSAFIDISQLTEEIAISWVKNSLGSAKVNELEIAVTNQAINLSMPELLEVPLPWTQR